MRVFVFVYTRTCVPVCKDQRLAVSDFLILLYLSIYLASLLFIYLYIYLLLFVYLFLYQFSDAFGPAHCQELLFLLSYSVLESQVFGFLGFFCVCVCGYWGSKHRSSCLCGKAFPTEPPPQSQMYLVFVFSIIVSIFQEFSTLKHTLPPQMPFISCGLNMICLL